MSLLSRSRDTPVAQAGIHITATRFGKGFLKNFGETDGLIEVQVMGPVC